MTKINLAEIEARAEKATEGPWRVSVSDAENNERYVVGSGGAFIFVDGHYHDESWCEISEADAEFIAHAREDVPALITEIKELQTSFCRAMESATDLGLRGFDAKQENNKLRKALEFYADSSRYEPRVVGVRTASYAESDGGEIARKALGGITNGD